MANMHKRWVAECYGASKRFSFPKPEVLLRQHLPTIRGLGDDVRTYGLSPKADGESIHLGWHKEEVFEMHNNGTCDSFWWPVRELAVWCGTLIHVEKCGKVYWIIDLVQMCGKDCKPLSYPQRLQLAEGFVCKCLQGLHGSLDLARGTYTSGQICTWNGYQIGVKPFWSRGDALARWKRDGRLAAPYEDDGYVWTPFEDPIGTGRQLRTFKHKPPHLCTSDLRVDDDGRLMCLRGKHLQIIGRLQDKPFPPSGSIVECLPIDVKQCLWKSIRLRPDKSRPNSNSNVFANVTAFSENIQLHELLV